MTLLLFSLEALAWQSECFTDMPKDLADDPGDPETRLRTCDDGWEKARNRWVTERIVEHPDEGAKPGMRVK